MKFTKLHNGCLPPQAASGEPRRVQGGVMRTEGNVISVESGGRFKLFSERIDRICISEGSGFIKWARGEIPFAPKDMLLAEQAGEYEINGVCKFTVVKE